MGEIIKLSDLPIGVIGIYKINYPDGKIYIGKSNNIKRYNDEFLFSDLDVNEAVCSYKQTTFCASMIASYMTNLLVNFCTNQTNPIIDRDLPFFTTYNAETMYLKTEA